MRALKKPVTMSKNLVRVVTTVSRLLPAREHSKANLYRLISSYFFYSYSSYSFFSPGT